MPSLRQEYLMVRVKHSVMGVLNLRYVNKMLVCDSWKEDRRFGIVYFSILVNSENLVKFNKFVFCHSLLMNWRLIDWLVHLYLLHGKT